MKKIISMFLLLSLLFITHSSHALSEHEVEDLADLAAVFLYLKTHCGYKDLPDPQIRQAIIYIAKQKRWDLSNYNSFNIQQLEEDSYNDLKSIAIPSSKKCKTLAPDALGLLSESH